MTNFLMLLSSFLLISSNTLSHEVILENKVKQLNPGQNTVLKFTSKGSDQQRQSILLNFDKPGDYTLTFSNGNPENSDHWLIWDCINLKLGDRFIWRIGEDETPPDYSPEAFDEFCQGKNCDQTFIVGKSSSNKLSKELNDHSVKEITIQFNIGNEGVKKELTLEISTLYSTHTGVDDYKMNISLK